MRVYLYFKKPEKKSAMFLERAQIFIQTNGYK